MTDTPIQVNADPTKDQIEALVRQIILTVSAIASALGYAGFAGKASALLMASGVIAGLISLVWGQVKTRTLSKKAAAMASLLPDHLAQSK